MSKQEATHKSHCGKWLYKIEQDGPEWHRDSLYKPTEFWDIHCNRWRPSIMHEHQLIKL